MYFNHTFIVLRWPIGIDDCVSVITRMQVKVSDTANTIFIIKRHRAAQEISRHLVPVARRQRKPPPQKFQLCGEKSIPRKGRGLQASWRYAPNSRVLIFKGLKWLLSNLSQRGDMPCLKTARRYLLIFRGNVVGLNFCTEETRPSTELLGGNIAV